MPGRFKNKNKRKSKKRNRTEAHRSLWSRNETIGGTAIKPRKTKRYQKET